MMKIFLMIGLGAFLVGCAGETPSFYVLSPEGPAPSGGGIGVGVGPVTLAEYVDRANLVIQVGPNEVQVAESHRWAGDLSSSVTRVMAANLGRRLGTGNVRTYPWNRDSEIDYQVVIDIRQFLAGYDGHAQLEASWRIYGLPGRGLHASRTFTGREPIETEDYSSVVAAQSRLLGRLSAEIAASIRRR